MHPRVDLAGDAAGEARDGFELLEGGVEEGVRGAEVVQDLLLARGADARQLVEDGGGHGPAAQLAVVGVGEAVGLVADPLQEVQLGGVASPG